MKTKLLAVMAIFGMVASASAVKINNNLSINGFIDGSYELIQNGDAGAGEVDEQTLGIDEVEVSFILNVGNVSGQISFDVEDHGAGLDDEVGLEQAHFTYNVNDAVSVTFGRYGSALGFEREDPSGLYTYSRAYGGALGDLFNSGDTDSNIVDGITVAYSGDSYTIAASFEEVADATLETEDLNLELSFTYTGIAGVNIGGGYFFDNSDVVDGETNVLNIHASRQFGKLLLAGEYTQRDTSGSTTAANNRENDGYLLLADYDVNDKLGVAIRFSNNENGTDEDYESFTIAPNYAITDSLGAILEYSDFEGSDDAASEGELIAVELTYTF